MSKEIKWLPNFHESEWESIIQIPQATLKTSKSITIIK